MSGSLSISRNWEVEGRPRSLEVQRTEGEGPVVAQWKGLGRLSHDRAGSQSRPFPLQLCG